MQKFRWKLYLKVNIEINIGIQSISLLLIGLIFREIL
jgi:hypothetical protein